MMKNWRFAHLLHHTLPLLALPLLALGCSSQEDASNRDGGVANDGASEGCREGESLCDGATVLHCEDGDFVPGETCPEVCAANLGCVLCEPGRGTCNSSTSATVCREDGQGYEEQFCDPVQGMTCNEATGACSGSCSQEALGSSYIGCEYYPTITGNGLVGDWDFAVIVSNTSGITANVVLEGGAAGISEEFSVAPNDVEVRRLPYDPVMQFCNSPLGNYCTLPSPYGTGRVGGAFRLRSDQPVTVYQFSPLDYEQGNTLSHSNDASLLLPARTLGTEYVVATWPTWVTPDRTAFPGIVAITATQDDTVVTITPTASASPFGQAGVAEDILMDRGDVLQLASDPGAIDFNQPTQFTEDLTGTQVASDKPIQVLGAHFCTRIPLLEDACDHLEESMFPVHALSNRYVVAAPYSATFERAPFITRIVATAPNTELQIEPSISGVASTLARAGDFVEIGPQSLDIEVTASEKVVVAQYMLAEDIVGTGDPSMNLPSPIEQWRSSYLFHAPTNYSENLATVIRPSGASVSIDGAEVTGWSSVGSTGYEAASVLLSDGVNGDHTLEASAPVGLSVYGYGRATSYWYPGGLDLRRILIE